jgi:hypothetical protein
LMAESLVKHTPPKNSSEGKGAVERDINKVWQKNEWFTEQFSFVNEKLDKRVKDAVRAKDTFTLEGIFRRSPRLRKLQIEPFRKDRHQRNDRGRVRAREANFFPVADQSQTKKYLAEEKKHVGKAKSGWAPALSALGGKVPSWVNKGGGNGSIKDNSRATKNPSITLINSVPYIAGLNSRLNIVGRSIAGRAKALKTRIGAVLRESRKKSGLSGS